MMQEQWQTCARCGGHFPGPGVEQAGMIYCCDTCAAGPMRMWPRMLLGVLPVAGLLLGTGMALGRYLGRRESWT